LIHLKEAVEDLDLCFLVETSSIANEVNSNFRSLAKENIQKIISVLHPQLKTTLVDCLRKNNILSHISGEEGGSKIWYAKYSDSLYPRPGAPRRHLVAEIPTPAPAVGPFISSPPSSPDPAPSPATVPSSPPESNPQHPVVSPQEPFFPPLQPAANEAASASPDTNSHVQENKKSNSHKSVVIAVAVTASVTFVVVALLFLCCSKVCRKGSGLRRNDERPLLGISFSEFSVGIYYYMTCYPNLIIQHNFDIISVVDLSGSSQKPFASGNSIKEEKLGHYTSGNNSSQHKKGSSLDGNFHIESVIPHSSLHETSSVGAAGGVAKFSPESVDPSSNVNGHIPPLPLKPPPGRLRSTTSVLLPLKPPPGRADPLPPEPPSSFRPPPRKAGPPPPPVPPPSLKPSSSGAGPRPPGPPPPPPPVPPGAKTGSRPPPPPKSGVPPPRPPQPTALSSKVPRPPLGSKHSSNATSSEEAGLEGEADAPKVKLKPFFWDKVLASPDQSMVWHQIKSGSFQ